MPRDPATPVTPERLRQAAVYCIQHRGYAATTARDVTTRAQANLASIGYYFGSMESLLDEALVIATESWIDPLVALATEADGESDGESEIGSDRLRRGLKTFLESLPEHRQTAVGLFEALARVDRSEPLRERLAAQYDRLRAALAGNAAGDARADAAASAVVALLDGVVIQWLIDGQALPEPDLMVEGLAGMLCAATGHSGD